MLEAAFRQSLSLIAPGPRTIVLAVSGGPDSLALLQTAAVVAAGAPDLCFHVVTVDHGLRTESAAEAAGVGAIAHRFGVPHSVRRWAGEKPPGNLQGRARDARYRLLTDAARALGAAAVMTGHHQDDQIETHFLAVARHAGDRGRAGMRPHRTLAPGLLLLRPFLDIPGCHLKASVAGLSSVDDPSNRDRRFARVRMRQALADGAPDRAALLSAMAGHASARDAADLRLAESLRRLQAESLLAIRPLGTIELDRLALAQMASQPAMDLLGRIVLVVSGASYPPTYAATARLLTQATRGAQGSGTSEEGIAATLGGVSVAGASRLVFAREYGRSGPDCVKLLSHAPTVFDGRFDVGPCSLGDMESVGDVFQLVPFGRLGRGNAIEKTLPVVLDEAGRPVAAPLCLHAKLPPGVENLPLAERLSWRLCADLSSGPPRG